MVIDIEEWNQSIRRLLDEMGLFDLLDVVNRPLPVEPYAHSTSFIRYRSHDQVIGAEAVELRKAIEEITGALPLRAYLFRGVSEAMTNVLKHAYPDGGRYEGDPVPNRWWMAGSFERETRLLSVMFYDQGVGIPSTLPRKYPLERLLGWFHEQGLWDDDGNRIAAAMAMGRTRSGDAYRGKGLPNIKEFVDRSGGGSLRILSGRGEYIYEKGSAPRIHTHRVPLGGTLIVWEVQV